MYKILTINVQLIAAKTFARFASLRASNMIKVYGPDVLLCADRYTITHEENEKERDGKDELKEHTLVSTSGNRCHYIRV